MEDHSDNAFEAVNQISNMARSVDRVASDLSAVGLDRSADALTFFASEISKQADIVRRSMSLDISNRAAASEQATKNMLAAAIVGATGGSRDEIKKIIISDLEE